MNATPTTGLVFSKDDDIVDEEQARNEAARAYINDLFANFEDQNYLYESTQAEQ